MCSYASIVLLSADRQVCGKTIYSRTPQLIIAAFYFLSRQHFHVHAEAAGELYHRLLIDGLCYNA